MRPSMLGANYYKLKKLDEALTDFNKVKDIPKTGRHAVELTSG